MAAQIKGLCDSEVDGLFVSIPSSTVADAVQYCQTLNIPVIGVNSGVDYSDKLGLLHHVGQLEVAAGYKAGKRLVEEGTKRGWCVNHEPDNESVHQRCEGMEMAFNEVAEVEYAGQIEVPHNNDENYVSVVESTIGIDGSWDGIGLLLAGQAHAEAAADLFAGHSEAAMGIHDVSENIFASLNQGKLAFAIDQQPYLQGPSLCWCTTHTANSIWPTNTSRLVLLLFSVLPPQMNLHARQTTMKFVRWLAPAAMTNHQMKTTVNPPSLQKITTLDSLLVLSLVDCFLWALSSPLSPWSPQRKRETSFYRDF